jgi:hypothetical protein
VVTIARKGSKRPFNVHGWTCMEYLDASLLEPMLVDRFTVELQRSG